MGVRSFVGLGRSFDAGVRLAWAFVRRAGAGGLAGGRAGIVRAKCGHRGVVRASAGGRAGVVRAVGVDAVS